jgi:hypothetical protein
VTQGLSTSVFSFTQPASSGNKIKGKTEGTRKGPDRNNGHVCLAGIRKLAVRRRRH